MRQIRILFLALLLCALAAGSILAQAAKLPTVNIKEYKLKNGLTVVMHQDRSTPIAAVNVWYHVGSKNEVPGRTGFAHLFEHMMFQGSRNYNADYFTPLQEAGGDINGTTDEDRTWYYETLPSNFLEMALFMEADRMGGLLDAMTIEKLNNQRDVVKNERRQRVDNQPYGTSFEKIGEIMYPKGHPYNWSVIGSLSDLQAASMEDVKAFFRQYYVPNNAVLVLSGDFDEKQARGWVDKYFGKIPAGKPITNRPNNAMPKLDQVIRTVVDDPLAPLPRRYMVWHTVPRFHPDEPALDILGNILSAGRGSRLQSKLVYDKQLVSQVGAGNNTNEIGGVFQVVATARPNKPLDEIESEINAELELIKKDGPTADEVSRATSRLEAQRVFGLQTVFGKGSQISNFAGYLKNPNYFQSNLDRYAKVTAEDIKRVANKYLQANHLVMTFNPAPNPAAGPRGPVAADQATSSKSEKRDQAKIDAQAAKLPKPGPDPKLTLPPIEKTRLSNGLEVWMVPHNELPVISMNLVMKTGSTNEPDDRPGVAGMMTGLMNTGTRTRSALDIANELQAMGSSINVGGGWDSTTVSAQTLTKHLDKTLALYADMVMNASFPESEFTSQRNRALDGLRAQRANANAVAGVAYNRVLYGTHPYGRSTTEASLRAIGRDDVVRYYQSTFKPNNGVLIVVGNYDKPSLISKLESAFSGWKAGDSVTARQLPATQKLPRTGIYLVDRPRSAQSIVSIGHVGVERSNPDYFPLQVMNSILGGGITSRISMNLREDKGYTYGAGGGMTFRRGPGPYRAGGDMQTKYTKESIQELMREITEIRGSRPVSQKELEYNKQSLIRGYPAAFETPGGIAGQLSNLVVYGLPDTYFNDYIARVNAVTLDDVNRVAKQYLDPEHMAIVIVGDRSVIEPGLKELGYPITLLDTEGNTIAAQAPPNQP